MFQVTPLPNRQFRHRLNLEMHLWAPRGCDNLYCEFDSELSSCKWYYVRHPINDTSHIISTLGYIKHLHYLYIVLLLLLLKLLFLNGPPFSLSSTVYLNSAVSTRRGMMSNHMMIKTFVEENLIFITRLKNN